MNARLLGAYPLLLLTAFLSLSGCKEENGPVKPDYGPQVSIDDIYDAMDDLYRDSDPFATKIGAFVHFQTVHLLAGGQLRIHAADTGHTVVKRVDSECHTTFHIIEKRFTHKQDGTSDLLKRELELPLRTSSSGPCAQVATKTGFDLGAMPADLTRKTSSLSTTEPRSEPASEPQAPGITFHRLKSWETRAPAPNAVRARPKENPNCLGIPDCEITYRHVSFDIVYWDNPQGELVRLEYVASPDIPQTSGLNMAPLFLYIPGLFKACATQMMSLGEDAGKTLVTECQEVVDFTYEAPPTP